MINRLRKAYRSVFHRWSVVEMQPQGGLQIVSTHMSYHIAFKTAFICNHLVVRTDTALARIERTGTV
jgi:hypothetical protein